MNRNIVAPLTAGILLTPAGAAQAGTRTDGFTVSATVSGNCPITAQDMNFGTFDLLDTTDQQTNSDILVRSATRAQVWGNGTSGSTLVGGSLLVNPGKFSVNEIVHPIYGRIPPLQSPEPDNYTDTILITLSF